jgi:23S rRNA (cytosine1962-C5)-methyltransferase
LNTSLDQIDPCLSPWNKYALSPSALSPSALPKGLDQTDLSTLPSPLIIDDLESRLGRAHLNQPGYTECYRIINGEADGYPGWRVDRYKDWLLVIHDVGMPYGPLPPSKGVYLIQASPDRSQGQQKAPQFWYGTPAPDVLQVYEAGTQYHVQLGTQLSTGLFLDQRPQRQWMRHQGQFKRVLNTFAHAGGFSIACASAGAQTVSIDLSKSWLDRIPAQLELNGLNVASDHDRIYGDVFDWLKRLAKRGERFDLIILDPPSTSLGSKKKRWSAYKDYPELVHLALPLLEPGGTLLTATNYRKFTPGYFAHTLVKAMPSDLYLDRVCPPSLDFPTCGPMGIKNLIWKRKH